MTNIKRILYVIYISVMLPHKHKRRLAISQIIAKIMYWSIVTVILIHLNILPHACQKLA